MSTNSNWKEYYHVASDYYHRDLDRIFQRLNYFLIATAFLITGFIAVMASQKFLLHNLTSEIYWLALAICIIGILLSGGFAVINFLNAKIVFDIAKYVRKLETDDDYSPPFGQTLVIAGGNRFSLLLCVMLPIHTLAYIARTSIDELRGNKSDNGIYIEFAPHTWLLPMFFCLVWLGFIIYIVFDTSIAYKIYSIIAFISLLTIFVMSSFQQIRILRDKECEHQIKNWRWVGTIFSLILCLRALDITLFLFNT